MQDNQKNKWTIKDKLEITEAIFTIVVSLMAIWGTLVAWENGFWHKIERIADHLHNEYTTDDHIRSVEDKAVKMINEVKKLM